MPDRAGAPVAEPDRPAPGVPELTMSATVERAGDAVSRRPGYSADGDGAGSGAGSGRGSGSGSGSGVGPGTGPTGAVITRRPVPINHRDFKPAYPARALHRGARGVVVLRLDIDAEGWVRDAAVVRGAGHGFDQAAVAYGRRLRFEPARAGKQPVPARITWTVRFRGTR